MKKNKDQLAESAMPKLERIVSYMTRRLGQGADIDEIRSHAMVGLADAIERYDPSQGVSIDKFAAKRIQGAIYDGLTGNNLLPRRLLRQVAFLRASEEMLRYENLNPPPQDKVETVHRLANRLKDLACAYVTTCTATAEEQTDADVTTNAEYMMERKQYYAKIESVLQQLPAPQLNVIERFFFEEEHLKDIAADFGKSKSWASRQLQAALQNLRDQFPDVQ